MDFFRPKVEPERTLYDVVLEESRQRKNREPKVWMQAEREVMLRTAVSCAIKLGLNSPTMGQVEIAERMATGHVDYLAKWAYGVMDFMKGRV